MLGSSSHKESIDKVHDSQTVYLETHRSESDDARIASTSEQEEGMKLFIDIYKFLSKCT
jgi:hypothetical protein